MWKNFIIAKRHYIQAAVEIIFPIILTILLAKVRSIIEPQQFPVSHYESFEPSPIGSCSL